MGMERRTLWSPVLDLCNNLDQSKIPQIWVLAKVFQDCWCPGLKRKLCNRHRKGDEGTDLLEVEENTFYKMRKSG